MANRYQKRFVGKALWYLPHSALLHLAVKLKLGGAVRVLDATAKKYIIKNTVTETFDEALIEAYTSTISKTTLWHGSGRFQHTAAGDSDIFLSVLQHKGFQPAYDAYGIFSDGQIMTSTSFTTSRIIARCYADMHGAGYREKNRYGDALTWTAYFYGLFYARMYTVEILKVLKYYKTWHKLAHDENGHATWGKKVNKRAQDVWDVFGLGSDIPNNFPILYGVKNVDLPMALARTFRDYETRSSNPVLLKQMTHLEVPASKVEEVKELLRKQHVALPVFSIELGEYVASQKAFRLLLG